MSIINIPKLYKKIVKYVDEFYTEPKQIKENPNYIQMLECSLRNLINSVVFIKQLNKERTKLVNSTQNGIKCLQQNIKKLEQIGSGAFGIVYKINNNTAVKIEKLLPSANISTIKNEFKFSKLAGELGIGPKVYDTFFCTGKDGTYSIIYMDFINGQTLKDWLNKNKSEQLKLDVKIILTQKINLLHKHKMFHNDLHSENIIVIEANKKIKDVFIIDYGTVEDIETNYHKRIEYDNKDMQSIFGNKLNKEKDNIVKYVIQRLIDNKDIIIHGINFLNSNVTI